MELLMQALTLLSQAIGNELIFCIILGAMVLLTEKRAQKRRKIVLAIVITFLLVLLLKNIFAVERPCMAGEGCPELFFPDYSFPSGHAAMAFIVMIAFLDKPSFPFFWLFALFVSFSRLLLGVHTFEDIAASLVLAPISYSLTDFLWRRFLGK